MKNITSALPPLLCASLFLISCNRQPEFPTPTLAPEPTSMPTSKPSPTPISSTEVVIISPPPNTVVASPLTIKGQAPGTWMFEANLPLELHTSTGEILFQGSAHADGDWMTESLVPFTGTITFTIPSEATEGYLVIKKDNPSGLPENDRSQQFPVRFK